MLAAQRKRLARWAACDHIYARQLLKVKITNIPFENLCRIEILAQRSASVRVEFHKGTVVKTSKFKTFGQTTCSGK